MISLSVIGIIINLLFFLWFLFVSRRNLAADNKLAFLYLLFLLVFAFNYYEFSGIMNKYPAFIFLDMGIPFLIGPVIWSYVLKLVNSPVKNSNFFIHYVPALLIYVLFTDIVFMNPDEKMRLLQSPASTESIRYQVATVVQLIPVPVYLIVSITKLSTYNKMLRKVYSETDSINHKWLKFILTVFLLFWCIMSLGIIFINFLNITTLGMGVFMSGLITFSLLTGIYGVKRNIIISKITEVPTDIRDSKINTVIDIRDFVQKNKTYLQAELTLYQLAEALNIPAHVLSRVLSLNYSTSFFDFINEYRIIEFKRKIKEKEHLKFSILSLAFDCGFNSKSAFYRFFKKSEGLSPGQYIKRQNTLNQK